MYLGQGIGWAHQMRPIAEPEPTCGCGRPVEPNDFLCHRCRAELTPREQMGAEETGGRIRGEEEAGGRP